MELASKVSLAISCADWAGCLAFVCHVSVRLATFAGERYPNDLIDNEG